MNNEKLKKTIYSSDSAKFRFFKKIVMEILICLLWFDSLVLRRVSAFSVF